MEDALNTLAFTKKRVAATVEKLLRSALDNANFLEQRKGHRCRLDNLYVKQAVANDGPRMKRIRPAPHGTGVPLCAAHCAYRVDSGGTREEAAKALATVVRRRAAAAPAKAEDGPGAKKAVGKKKAAAKKKTASSSASEL